jgi:hypothetical protein
LKGKAQKQNVKAIALERNFLHAAELQLAHPKTGKTISLKSPLPEELQGFLSLLEPGLVRPGEKSQNT